MASEKVQLRKVRSFSDALNDMLQFLKQEFKPLMRSFFLICGIFILAGAVLNGLYSSNITGIFTEILKDRYNESYYQSSSVYGPTYFLTILFSCFTQMIVYSLMASYMKVYEQKNNESPTLEEVWTVFKRNVLYIIFYGLIFGLLFCIGFIFCLAPGFYLYTVFAPFGYILVIEEDKSLGSIFGRCFVLIKEDFWPSLGLYILSSIIYSSCASIIGLIIGGLTGLLSYFTTKDVRFVGATVGAILQVFSSAFSILLYLAIGMQYFSLEEKSNGTGLMARIQNLGNGFDNNDEDRSTSFIKE